MHIVCDRERRYEEIARVQVSGQQHLHFEGADDLEVILG